MPGPTHNQVRVLQTMTRLLFKGGYRGLYKGYSLNVPEVGDVSLDFHDGRKIKILPNGTTQWADPVGPK